MDEEKNDQFVEDASNASDSTSNNQDDSLAQPLYPNTLPEPLKIYNCMLCNYKTPRKGGLKAHYAMHSEIRPFACDLCSYTAKRKYDLKKHKIIKHNKRFSKAKRFSSSHISLMAQHSEAGTSHLSGPSSSISSPSLNDSYEGEADSNAQMMVKMEPDDYYDRVSDSNLNAYSGHSSQETLRGCEDYENGEVSSHCTSTTHDQAYTNVHSQSTEAIASSSDHNLFYFRPSEGQLNFHSLDGNIATPVENHDNQSSSYRGVESSHVYELPSPYLGNNLSTERSDQSSVSSPCEGVNSSFSQPDFVVNPDYDDVKPSCSSTSKMYAEEVTYNGPSQDVNSDEKSFDENDTIYIDESTSENCAEDLRKIPEKVHMYDSNDQQNNMPVNLSFNKDRDKGQKVEKDVCDDASVKHIATMTRRMFSCEHCDIMFGDSALYLMHVGLHGNDDPWKCKLCDRSFHDVYGFTSHFVNQHK